MYITLASGGRIFSARSNLVWPSIVIPATGYGISCLCHLHSPNNPHFDSVMKSVYPQSSIIINLLESTLSSTGSRHIMLNYTDKYLSRYWASTSLGFQNSHNLKFPFCGQSLFLVSFCQDWLVLNSWGINAELNPYS